VGYREKVAMATMMEGMGKKKKKAQLRKDIKEAKEAGYNVVIKYDPESGDYLPTFSYKQPTKTQAEKDAEVTEIFQGEAKQAYGGGFEKTQGALNQPVASRVDPRTGQQIPVMRRETGGPIGGPGHAGPMRAKEQRMQQFRAPFDRAGQIMRPDPKGQFAPIKKPDGTGVMPGGFAGSKWQYDKVLGDLKVRNIMKRTDMGIDIKVDNPTRRHAIEHLQMRGHRNWKQDPEAVKLVMSYPVEDKAAVTKKRVLKSQLTEEAIQATMKKHQISREELMSRIEVIEE